MLKTESCKHGCREGECATCERSQRNGTDNFLTTPIITAGQAEAFVTPEDIGSPPPSSVITKRGSTAGSGIHAAAKPKKVKAGRPYGKAKAAVVSAAEEAADKHSQPFSFTHLLIVAWKANPKLFGLPEAIGVHPDARKLAVCLYGKKGLIAAGLLRRREDGLLELGREST